jgi:hypothetical protein
MNLSSPNAEETRVEVLGQPTYLDVLTGRRTSNGNYRIEYLDTSPMEARNPTGNNLPLLPYEVIDYIFGYSGTVYIHSLRSIGIGRHKHSQSITHRLPMQSFIQCSSKRPAHWAKCFHSDTNEPYTFASIRVPNQLSSSIYNFIKPFRLPYDPKGNIRSKQETVLTSKQLSLPQINTDCIVSNLYSARNIRSSVPLSKMGVKPQSNSIDAALEVLEGTSDPPTLDVVCHKTKDGSKPKSHKTDYCREFAKGNCSLGDRCRFIHEIPAEENRQPSKDPNVNIKPVFQQVRLCTDNAILFDGESFHTNLPNHLIVDEGAFVAGVVSSGPGYIIQSDDPKYEAKYTTASAAFETQDLPAFRHGEKSHEVFYPPKTYLVFVPLLSQLCKQLPGSTLDAAWTKAVYQLGERFFATWPSLMEHANITCEYHIHRTYYKRHMQVDEGLNLCRITRNNEVVGGFDMSERLIVAGLGNQLQNNTSQRIHDVECILPDEYEFRTDFEYQVAGATFDVENRIYPNFNTNLPVDPQNTKNYRTSYMQFCGLGVPGFCEFGKTPNNATKALKRLLAARPNEEFHREMSRFTYRELIRKFPKHHKFTKEITDLGGYHFKNLANLAVPEELALSKELFGQMISSTTDGLKYLIKQCHRTKIQWIMDKYGDGKKWLYYSMFESFSTLAEPFIPRTAASNIIHAKRELRKRYVNGQRLSCDDMIMIEKLAANIKRELAKCLKVPRLFVDYGAGCMYANELPEFVKVCIDGEHSFAMPDGFTVTIFVMAKPKTGQLTDLFRKAYDSLNTAKHLLVLIYSDDSVYIGNRKGVSFAFNVDISSNDSSQDAIAFGSVGLAMARFFPSRALGLLKQCKLPIKLSNPDNKAEFITIKFNTLFEGSGSVLTTILNHFASFSIALNVGFLMATTEKTNEDCINVGAAYAGHVVTSETCSPNGLVIFEKVQFLKHSPLCDEFGTYYSTLNYGCLFRSFGSIDDSPTPQNLGMSAQNLYNFKDFDQCELVCSRRVQGECNEPSSLIMIAMRNRFNKIYDQSTLTFKQTNTWRSIAASHDLSSILIDTQSICRRYDCCESELRELETMIASSRVGSLNTSSAVAKFFVTDYGMSYDM